MSSSSTKSGQRKNRWAIDLNRKDKAIVSSNDLQLLGYNERQPGSDSSSRENNPDLIAKKSWDIALGPVKQIPMNVFLMWMAGNSISIFPIMMVGMMFIRPIQAMLGAQQSKQLITNYFICTFNTVYTLY
ncbi:DgyrCDS6571 [Dimorphilus gyrociliatus]|uniref:ER membrane protein complex subunit 4 n=1 Tax=Dimorphilus gyrociliatus TaxID=2664684 RepID=A0A7I8VT82_9ANNE|nr:DgyrCDS6571 [Dimorphilus gyrociliatus]